MYKNFFGFKRKPFELTPDPSFLYLSPDLEETIATLRYGIIQRRGFVLLIGEPGTGKTTLLNSLIEQEGRDTNFAYIFDPDLNFSDLLQTVLMEFNLASIDENLSKNKALHRLKTFVTEQFEKDSNTAIIVDEAQGLDIKILENIRLLSNLETRRHKLIQIILSGQPQLENTLNHSSLTQLVQRIGLRRRTKALTEKETYEYLDHRLKVAGYNGPQLFANKARHLIWTYSKGIPRTINIICENSLIAGYSTNKTRIDASIIQEAHEDLNVIPLGSFDNSRNGFIDTPAEIDQPPPDQHLGVNAELQDLAEIPELSEIPELLEVEDEDAAGFIDKIRNKLNISQESESDDKQARRFRVAWIAAIAGVVIIANIAVLYLFAGGLKEFKHEFSLKLEALKDKIQTTADLTNEILSGNQDKGKPIDQETDGHKNENVQNIVTKPIPDNGTVTNSSEAEAAEKKALTSVAVRRGETLSKIIFRVYGREDAKILEEVLKINPEINNPDLIYENQIIRLPQNTD